MSSPLHLVESSQPARLRRPFVGRLSALAMATLGALIALGAPAGEARAQHHQNFRVATYNVRHESADDTGDYAWESRKAGLIELLRSRDLDVFGVQEVSSKPIRDALRAAFGDDYGVYRPTPGGSPKMIFYKKSRFERLAPDQYDNFYLENPYPESESCHSNARGRTLAWIKLRDKRSGRVYMFINMHTAHSGKCWKARNAAADRVHQLLADHVSDAVTFVLMGDFNMDEQRDPAPDPNDKMVTRLEENKAGYRLRRSARHSGKTNRSTWTFNNAWKKPSSTRSRLDYLFVNSHDATTYRQSVDQQTIKDILGSGADISPSDHFLVRAEIRQAPFDYLPVVSTHEGIASDHISFGDVNGDGRVDLIRWKTSVESGRVRVHLADGTGGFLPDAIVDPNTGETGEWRFFADIDGDGCAERISWSRSIAGGALRVGRSNCDGTFESEETHNSGATRGGTQWFFARLNADSCLDRVAWHPEEAGGQTRVALAKCDGSLEFAPEEVTTDPGTTTYAGATLAFADIDGDGLDDKILWDLNQHNKRTVVYRSQGDGDFAFFHEHAGGSSGVSTTRLYFGDVDGDGFSEKAFWRPTFRQGFMQLYPGSADGLIGHPMMVNSGPSEDEKTDFHLADVNGDGSADLIRWNLAENPNQVEVYPALVAQPRPDPEPQGPGDAGVDAGLDAGADAASHTDDDAGVDASSSDDAGPDAHAARDATPGEGADISGAKSSSNALTGGCGCHATDLPNSTDLIWLGLGLFGVGLTRRKP